MSARGSVKRVVIVGAAAALATAGAMFTIGGSAGAGLASAEKSYEEEGHHDYVVPAGVCWVWIDAFGAQGGDAISTADSTDPDTLTLANPGGLGGEAKARIAVTPGETLHVNVGGEGGDAVDGVPGEGGENGGGDGGSPANVDDEGGGGGGGASDVRQGGEELSHRVVVAGGGGGAGAGISEEGGGGGAGGDGGGEEGDDGEPSFGALETQAGEGGSQSEGGDGGVVDPGSSDRNGDEGEAGEGGDGGGADPQFFVADGGGGGGGGLYGGGGGAASRSDAGGEFEDGAGGGGGSGFGPSDTDFEDGEHEDDGEVTVSYDPVADACVEAIVIEPRFTG